MAHEVDAVVVGAGFAGLALLHRLRGLGFRTVVVDAAADVGGTWYWNRYPGARCDIESVEYSFSFDEELQQDWHWSERYAAQPEILAYARHVADRFDLRRDIRLGTRVERATFDEVAYRWSVVTDQGDYSARFLVMATGMLSAVNAPDFPGLADFSGATYHTARWPEDGVDFTGQRVAVVGTGSSAIQAIPIIAEQARQLFIFQRTAAYSVPARNRPLDPAEEAAVKADYAGMRARDRQMPGGFGSRFGWNERPAQAMTADEQEAELERRWEVGGFALLGAFADMLTDTRANEIAAEFVRRKIRATVDDPTTADLLCPTQPIGCKRLCLDTGYYATYNRPNVHLVDVSTEPIERVTPDGLVTGGTEYPVDAIVFATGFDAMTGAIARIDIVGRNGQAMQEAWCAGPVNYLGLTVPGFPNLFLVTGPGSPSVLTNMIVSIEQHVDWISTLLARMRDRGLETVEATEAAARAWVEEVNALASFTLYPSCSSWYLGANVPGKPRVFMPYPGFPMYTARCNAVVDHGYEGLVLA
ncbi:MAG: flavin-containing monooxygenase [Actinomycetota bacterium]